MDHGKLIQSKHLASAKLILLAVIAWIVLSLYPLKKKLLFAHAVSLCVSVSVHQSSTLVFIELLRLSEGQAGGAWESFKQTNVFSEKKKISILKTFQMQTCLCRVRFIIFHITLPST